MQSKDEYVQFLHRKLDEWNADIDRLRLKADIIEVEKKADLQNQIDMLQSKRRDVEERLRDLSYAGTDAWEDMKGGLDLAWEATSKSADRARWGAGYVRRLVQLSPEDTVEIERASSSVLEDLMSQERGLEVHDIRIIRMGYTLVEWSAAEVERQKVLDALSKQLGSSCAGLSRQDPALAACTSFARTAEAETAKG